MRYGFNGGLAPERRETGRYSCENDPIHPSYVRRDVLQRRRHAHLANGPAGPPGGRIAIFLYTIA